MSTILVTVKVLLECKELFEEEEEKEEEAGKEEEKKETTKRQKVKSHDQAFHTHKSKPNK